MVVLFDNHYLNLCCRPKTEREYAKRLANRLIRDPYLVVVIPAVIVYEMKRAYLLGFHYQTDPAKREDFRLCLEKLDSLMAKWEYSPLTREILDDAAQLWADNQGNGQPNTSPERIDIDVIVAAEALRRRAHVWTQNEKHFTKLGIPIAEL